MYPRPVQNPLPVYVGVGGTPQSVVRAATLGLPLIIAIIGGNPAQFRPFVDLYRQTWKQAGHDPAKAFVGVHHIGFVADADDEARDLFWPPYRETFGRIGRDRGWPAPTRPQYDAQCGEQGALIVGDPGRAVAKILAENEALGGVDRVSLQLDLAGLTPAQVMRAIELLGTRVAPEIRKATAGVAGPSAGGSMRMSE